MRSIPILVGIVTSGIALSMAIVMTYSYPQISRQWLCGIAIAFAPGMAFGIAIGMDVGK